MFCPKKHISFLSNEVRNQKKTSTNKTKSFSKNLLTSSAFISSSEWSVFIEHFPLTVDWTLLLSSCELVYFDGDFWRDSPVKFDLIE